MKTHLLPEIDQAALVEVLDRYRDRVAPHPHLRDCNSAPGHRRLYTNYQAIFTGETRQALLADLGRVQGLNQLGNYGISFTPGAFNGEGQVLPHFTDWLLSQLLLRPTAEVAASLVEFLRRNSVELEEVQLIWGIHPAEEISLGSGFTLLPTSALTPHPLVDLIHGASLPPQSPVANPWYNRVKPRAALVRRTVHKPVIALAAWVKALPPDSVSMTEASDALVLMAKGPVSRLLSYFSTRLSEPCYPPTDYYGHGAKWAHNLEVASPMLSDDATYVISYLGLKHSARERFSSAVVALNLAHEYHSGVNRLLELGLAILQIGIALEAMFTQKERNTEVTFRMRLRGAAWLGATSTEKAEIFNILGEIYDLRSKVAHGEQLESKLRRTLRVAKDLKWHNKTVPAEEFVRRALELATRAVGTLIVRGGVPEWNSYVLDGGSRRVSRYD